MKACFMDTPSVTIVLTSVAGLLYVAGYIPYIRAILHHTAKPMQSSWLIFAILDVIAIAGMYDKGVLNGQIIGALMGSSIVMSLSLFFGTSDWKKLDVMCMIGACTGLYFWWLTSNATIGIFISVAIMFVGCIPTFVSAWHHPQYENRTAWTLYFLSCILQLFAVSSWTFAGAVQPIGFAVMETIMMILLWVRPILLRKYLFISSVSKNDI